MCAPTVEVIPLLDTGNYRGSSFSLPLDLLDCSADSHIVTLKAGHVRGNHYHERRREILLVMHQDNWSMCWDTDLDTEIQRRSLMGSGTLIVKIETLASHAVVNDGTSDLTIVGLSNELYDASAPDSFPRVVAPPRG